MVRKRRLMVSKLQTDMTEGDIRVIRWEASQGKSRQELALEYGVSKQSIDRIVRRETFAWVLDNPETELGMVAKPDAVDELEADASMRKIMAKVGQAQPAQEEIPTPDQLYGDDE